MAVIGTSLVKDFYFLGARQNMDANNIVPIFLFFSPHPIFENVQFLTLIFKDI